MSRKVVFWMCGLSGAGKTTLAQKLYEALKKENQKVYHIDGDRLRKSINKDLSFSVNDRQENIRRAGEIAKLFYNEGYIVVVSLISPFQQSRDMVQNLFPREAFREIFIKCDLSVCEKRDPKGLYKKFREGEIADLTGIDSPFEAPAEPDLILETDKESIEQSFEKLLNYCRNHFE